jgi:hypothetical protein
VALSDIAYIAKGRDSFQSKDLKPRASFPFSIVLKSESEQPQFNFDARDEESVKWNNG